MSDFIFVYITNSSKDEAKKISRHLLDKKLIACANIYDGVTSMYHWEGKLAEETESVLIAKTTMDKFAQVKMEVEKIHTYKVPCIVEIPVSSNEKYFEWIKKELK